LTGVHSAPRADGVSKSPAGRNRESAAVQDNFEIELLQAQYKELKEKMKAMEEEVLIKNGEIKILRDSLHQTESVLEEQRRSHFLLEQEKAQALSDREKEFSKKLQSLQSELQFKDAEMNELRTKLQCNERAHKPAVPSTSHGSPRKSPSVALKPEACSPQFGKPSFPTKESFNADMSVPHPRHPEPGCKSLAGPEENKTHSLGGDPTKQEESPKSLVGSLMQRSNPQGSILISLLLKQPLIPGSPLGLCHLLSCGSEAPTSTLLQPLGLGSAGAGISGLRTTGSRDGPFPLSALREAQDLALTGLNLIAREEDSCAGAPAEGGPGAFPLCPLPGATHLLPLCLRPDVPLPSVLLAVELLALLADHQALAPQLCSRSEGCLLLLLYMYITSRPDSAATDMQWLHLEQEAVWLLAKLGIQSPVSPVTGSSCQCNAEVVRVLTVVLHRQWLTVRRAGRAPRTAQQRRTVRCLRDGALLLHSLSQKDKLFAVHCVGVLHQYDQAVPGVSALIRSLPDVTDCEEAALDDLCAAEPDADDPDMDCG
ncbi:ATR-interacting protein, partial [Myotis brandtii]